MRHPSHSLMLQHILDSGARNIESWQHGRAYTGWADICFDVFRSRDSPCCVHFSCSLAKSKRMGVMLLSFWARFLIRKCICPPAFTWSALFRRFVRHYHNLFEGAAACYFGLSAWLDWHRTRSAHARWGHRLYMYRESKSVHCGVPVE